MKSPLPTADMPLSFCVYCGSRAGDDPAFIAQSLGHIARARGMSRIAKEAGLSRESLYRALSGDGNPEFGTILKVFKALGLRLQTL